MAEITPWCYMVAKLEGGGLTPLGTGFCLGGREVATALHVVKSDFSNLHVVLPREPICDYQDTIDTAVQCAKVAVKQADPIRDLAILELPGDLTMNVSVELGSTDEVSPGETVTTRGYPHADSGRFVLTQHEAVVGAKVLLGNQGIKSKHIVLNTLARPGQSGGPVYNKLNQRIIAVLVGAYCPIESGGIRLGTIDPNTLHQTTHAVSAQYLAEMRGE